MALDLVKPRLTHSDHWDGRTPHLLILDLALESFRGCPVREGLPHSAPLGCVLSSVDRGSQ
jgi:hypothetical protein